jgi:hypothetical protein
MDIIQKASQSIADKVNRDREAELTDFLARHGLVLETLKKAGYELVLETNHCIERTDEVWKLCKVVDSQKLRFNYSMYEEM